MEIKNDILIRIKHFENNKIRYPLIRLMINTGFIFGNLLRFRGNQVDCASNVEVGDDFMIDVMIEYKEDHDYH